jgi:hypothetical protein
MARHAMPEVRLYVLRRMGRLGFENRYWGTNRMKKYPEMAIERAKDGALEWLQGEGDGYPMSWAEIERREKRYGGNPMYDDWEAPPIAGYEVLEREGRAVRMETIIREDGQERVHFRLKS